jgi:hypothetical protein
MREQVCKLLIQLLLGFASAVILRSSSFRTYDSILLSNLTLFSLFATSHNSQVYSGCILTCLRMVRALKVTSKMKIEMTQVRCLMKVVHYTV